MIPGPTNIDPVVMRAMMKTTEAHMSEPFGLVLIEAMAHGLPVIGSTADAMAEIIDEGQTGYLISVGDSKTLAERLTLLLSSPDVCADFGRAGKQKVAAQARGI